jgi:hypothetical protein
MSTLNLLLVPGYVRCEKCLSQIHKDLLACPNCLLLEEQARREQAGSHHESHAGAAQEQTLLFSFEEYPA